MLQEGSDGGLQDPKGGLEGVLDWICTKQIHIMLFLKDKVRGAMRNRIDIMRLRGFLRNIGELMWSRGIRRDPSTNMQFYTGYSYGTLYDWDMYFETIIQAYFGKINYAKNSLIVFLEHQRDSGFIPRCIPEREPEVNEHAKPFLAQTALVISRFLGDFSWIAPYYDKLKKFVMYWIEKKDVNRNSLSEWDSAPHTGMDNQHERAGKWNACFCEGVDLNSYLYRELIAMSKIAKEIGKSEDVHFFREKAEEKRKAIQSMLWNDEDKIFYDLDRNTGKQIKVKSVSSFTPLWAKIATPGQAYHLVYDHLLNPEEFWLPFPIPGYARSEAGYSTVKLPGDLGCNWRGATWIPTNYMVYHGLINYGYEDIAEYLAYRTYALVSKYDLPWEWYNCETGEGQGLHPFWGWSILGYILPIEHELKYDPTNLGDDLYEFIHVIIKER